MVAGSGPNWRNGAVLYQTEDRWIVSIGGYFGDHAPDDDQMFAAYAGSLPTSDIYDIVAHAEPLSDFVRYRYPANLRRRYERLTRFPAGYLVFGDAVCSFNPVYGQGMTVAAQEAALLRECLDAGDADLARRFLRRAATAIDTPWDIAVGNDLRHPQVRGAASAKGAFHQLVHRQAAHGRAATTPKLANAFLAGRQSPGPADRDCLHSGRWRCARAMGANPRRRAARRQRSGNQAPASCRGHDQAVTLADRSDRISRRSASRRRVSSPPDSR